ncbi:MAG: methyltransferase domain-containing protein [Porticoccaceae bacterium]|jgi:23S rRNA (guanine745-N1)-methyltransferase|nr:methyltransferase domain-containing protein [Porticoccaceae bacterium]MBT3798179.1 methyltransferase domain-containing protein [Porticoccaceae bacterium]MBT4590512.1 methyltransferase domain-containing protein [Porticoccaceae bacterium]MBT5104493.1 methyltransferase domain-containing protein [Porticoccaceae bacterium]MBT6027017.1 methyltransferase domain-containing protein [Porticoccaceae bacterium]
MIKSRQRFLNGGYYQPLADAITTAVNNCPLGFGQNLLDIGCGEGYYLEQLRNAAKSSNASLKLLGLDISKAAVRLAAKRKLDAQLVVDSAYKIPLFDNSIDTALSVFSPICPEETARILSTDGFLLMVGPGEEHLTGLTAHIYEQHQPHSGNFKVLDEHPVFDLKEQIDVKTGITVKGPDILDLLTMTPYYWHTSAEQQEKLAALPLLTTPIHFSLRIYQRTPF